MIRVEGESRPVLLFFAKAEEGFDDGLAMRPVLPCGGRAPLELGGLGRIGQGSARVDQCLNIDPVIDLPFGNGHRLSPSFLK
jgi:hypothetical protein